MEKINQKLGCGRLQLFAKPIPVFLSGLVLLFCCFFCHNAYAGLTIISDEETELYLQELIKPIFKAAGVPFNRNKIFIVEDDSLNAFVSDGNNLFVHTAVLLQAKSSDEIRGVLAHETGHILGGHILRHKLKQQELQNISLASMALAGALGAASGRGDVAAAVAIGSQGSLINKSLAYQVEEERSADEAAVKLLAQTGHSPQGLLNFMKKIQTQNKLRGIDENSYFRTHPMSGERLAFLRQAVKNSKQAPAAGTESRLKRIQAKLYAFMKTPAQTRSRYPAGDKSVEAQYARAIAAYKSVNLPQALALTDNLIRQENNNPHFRELKGQILTEQGNIAAAQKEFAKASALLPNSTLFQINEAQAALALSPSPADLKKIIAKLQKAMTTRPIATAWLLLAQAYDLNGQPAEAQYAAAEYSARSGDLTLAKKQAERAKQASIDPNLTLKADDLLRVIKTIERP